MHVRRIRLAGFMSHDKTEVVLPSSGVVLLTGNNGSGKSALVEGVSTAIYGQTLRKTSPFRDGVKGLAEVQFWHGSGDEEARYLSRLAWTGKTKQHKWEGGEGDTAYDTNTKSLDALASIVGAYDIWKRTHVFSSSDASSFTTATDAQRKQLLESLLGIDWFDTALKFCRADLKVAKPKLDRLQGEVASLLRDIGTHQEESATHQKELANLEEPPTAEDLKERKSKLNKLVRTAKEEMNQAHAKAQRLRTAGEVEAREAQTLNRKAKDMPDECFTCGQDIPAARKVAVLQASTDKLKEAKIKRADGKKELLEFQEEMEELQEDLSTLEGKLQVVVTQESTSQMARAHYTYVQNAVKNAATRTKTLADRATALDDEVKVAALDVAELDACANILGFKGVRAQVLGKALSGIEQMANLWLNRLVGDGITIELASYKENKKGNVTDSISLKVNGAGGGFGYDGASGGERRRIDVAILFALAEVAANAHGTHGTLFFDEVFDALDQEGMTAVTDALIDLSADRAVVVISHTHIEDLTMIAAKHIHVKDGVLKMAYESAKEMADDDFEV